MQASSAARRFWNSEQDWDAVIQVYLQSVFLLSPAAGRVMVKPGKSKIINLASMLSFQGGIRVPSHTASKSGAAGITRLMANEPAAGGLNINAIAPGCMATDNITPVVSMEPGGKAAALVFVKDASELDRPAGGAHVGVCGWQVGPFTEPGVQLGPLVSKRHYNNVMNYICIGNEEGTRLIAGGGRPDGVGEKDYFVAPTVFADCNNQIS